MYTCSNTCTHEGSGYPWILPLVVAFCFSELVHLGGKKKNETLRHAQLVQQLKISSAPLPLDELFLICILCLFCFSSSAARKVHAVGRRPTGGRGACGVVHPEPRGFSLSVPGITLFRGSPVGVPGVGPSQDSISIGTSRIVAKETKPLFGCMSPTFTTPTCPSVFLFLSFGKGKGRAGELAHPFTTCSSHDVSARRKRRITPFQEQVGGWRTRQPPPRVEARRFFFVSLQFFCFLILRRLGKSKAQTHHTSTYFHTRRVSI